MWHKILWSLPPSRALLVECFVIGCLGMPGNPFIFPKGLMRDGHCSLLSLKDGLWGNIATYAQYSPGRAVHGEILLM